MSADPMLLIRSHLSSRRCGVQLPIIWTDPRPDGLEDLRPSRALVPLPKGLIGSSCTNCRSRGSLTGALITDTADERDPNLLCLDCGYWRD
jgi:hypothetical protein